VQEQMKFSRRGSHGHFCISPDSVIWSLVWKLRYILVYAVLVVSEFGSIAPALQYMMLSFFAEKHGASDCASLPMIPACRQASSDVAFYNGWSSGLANCISWFLALSLGAYSDKAGRRPCFQAKAWLSLPWIVALMMHIAFGVSLWYALILLPLVRTFDTNGVLLASINDLAVEPTHRAPAVAVVIGGVVTAACVVLPFAALLPPITLVCLSGTFAVVKLLYLHYIFPETNVSRTKARNWEAALAPCTAFAILSRDSFIFRMTLVLVFSGLSQAGLNTILMPYLTGYVGFKRSDFLPLMLVCVPAGILAYAGYLRPLIEHAGQVITLRICLALTVAFPALCLSCTSALGFIVLCSIVCGPMTILSPTISGIKGSIISQEEQGVVQGAIAAITNLACGICDVFFGWFWVQVTAGGTQVEKSATVPVFLLSSALGLVAFCLACWLPSEIPQTPSRQMLIPWNGHHLQT